MRKANISISFIPKAIRLLLIFFCLFIIANGYSQPITWQRTYQGPATIDSGYQICSAPGGGFYFVGYSAAPNHIYVLRINGSGDVIWAKLDTSSFSQGLTARTCAASPDGGFVISGSGDMGYTIKIDSSGNHIWETRYNGLPGVVNCFRIIPRSEGGYYACGNFNSDYGWEAAWDLKVNSLGGLNEEIFWGSSYRVYTGAVPAIDYGFMTSGFYLHGDTLNASIWRSRFGGNDFCNDSIIDTKSIFVSIARTSSSYLLFGNYCKSDSSYLTFIAKTDYLGNVNFVYKFYSDVSEKALDLEKVNPNRFALSILRDSANGQIQCSRVIIIDSNGVILQSKTFPAVKYLSLNSILPISDGGFIFGGTYDYGDYWPSHATDFYAVRTDADLNFPLMPPIGIQPISGTIPNTFKLYQNFPNPFNPETRIKFDLPKDANVSITIYDALGRAVEFLSRNEFKKSGSYYADWNASGFSSGIYFCRIEADAYTASIKLMLVK